MQVASHQAEIESLNAQVATVSFGTEYWSQMWLQETHSPFPFLLDPERAAYQAFKLESSLIHAWGVRNLLYYAKAKLQGRETFGKRGDTHQLGGDFIIDAQGIVRLAHPSKDPTDRPAVAELLAVLEELID
jgi:peroxiredoxin